MRFLSLIILSKGGTYPSTLSLFLVDLFSVKHCGVAEELAAARGGLNATLAPNQTLFDDLLRQNTCSSKLLVKVSSA